MHSYMHFIESNGFLHTLKRMNKISFSLKNEKQNLMHSYMHFDSSKSEE